MCCAGFLATHGALLGVRDAGQVEIPPGMAEQVERDAQARASVQAAQQRAEQAKASARSATFALALIVGVVLLVGTGAIRGEG